MVWQHRPASKTINVTSHIPQHGLLTAVFCRLCGVSFEWRTHQAFIYLTKVLLSFSFTFSRSHTWACFVFETANSKASVTYEGQRRHPIRGKIPWYSSFWPISFTQRRAIKRSLPKCGLPGTRPVWTTLTTMAGLIWSIYCHRLASFSSTIILSGSEASPICCINTVLNATLKQQ